MRKLNTPSKHTTDTNLWGVPLLGTTTRHQHTQSLIDRNDCTGKKSYQAAIIRVFYYQSRFSFYLYHHFILLSLHSETKILT